MSTFKGIREKIKENLATTLVAFVITILTVFSERIVDNIKSALNRADDRRESVNKITTTLSEFIFTSKNASDYLYYGTTDKQTMKRSTDEYNESITELKKNEYVFIGNLYQFWYEQEVEQFDMIMTDVTRFDSVLHTLNLEVSKVLYGTDSIINQAVAREKAIILLNINKDLENDSKQLLKKMVK